jgi:hypothetical protein
MGKYKGRISSLLTKKTSRGMRRIEKGQAGHSAYLHEQDEKCPTSRS